MSSYSRNGSTFKSEYVCMPTIATIMTLISIRPSISEVTSVVVAGPAIQHLQQLCRGREMVGEEAKVTEVSRVHGRGPARDIRDDGGWVKGGEEDALCNPGAGSGLKQQLVSVFDTGRRKL